jgi:hypothetical protein
VRPLGELAARRERCATLGRTGSTDVANYTYAAWADGFAAALEAAWQAGSVVL